MLIDLLDLEMDLLDLGEDVGLIMRVVLPGVRVRARRVALGLTRLAVAAFEDVAEPGAAADAQLRRRLLAMGQE